jgi:hypothetical protein
MSEERLSGEGGSKEMVRRKKKKKRNLLKILVSLFGNRFINCF